MATPKTGSATAQQITQSAGYYQPGVYAVLSRGDSFKGVDDPDDVNWIKLTTAQRGLGNQAPFLQFIVGILPPATTVTHALLDRSASLADKAPPIEDTIGAGGSSRTSDRSHLVQDQTHAPQSSNAKGKYSHPVAGVPGEDRGPPLLYQYTKPEVAAIIREAYVARYHREPTANELALYTLHSYAENSGTWPNNNPGSIGNLLPPEVHRAIPGDRHGVIQPGQQTWGVWGEGAPQGA